MFAFIAIPVSLPEPVWAAACWPAPPDIPHPSDANEETPTGWELVGFGGTPAASWHVAGTLPRPISGYRLALALMSFRMDTGALSKGA